MEVSPFHYNYLIIYFFFATANASLQDCSGYTALDYALERQLHYCALLLSSSQTAPTEETDFG